MRSSKAQQHQKTKLTASGIKERAVMPRGIRCPLLRDVPLRQYVILLTSNRISGHQLCSTLQQGDIHVLEK